MPILSPLLPDPIITALFSTHLLHYLLSTVLILSFIFRAATYNTRVKWIQDNSQVIRDCISSKMKGKVAV